MYGFIYITTNHVNGKKYIGQKKYDRNGKWKKYLGSGIALKNAIIKYGIENFSKEIIEECETKELLDEREIYWITFYNASKDDLFYNIASGGDGGNVVLGYTEEEYIAFQNKRLKAVNLGRKQGEESGVSKLTEKQVLDIIERLISSIDSPQRLVLSNMLSFNSVSLSIMLSTSIILFFIILPSATITANR